VPTYTAVDLGATSGRVVNVRLDASGIDLDVVHRFPTTTLANERGHLVWDFDQLMRDVRDGIATAATRAPVQSVAVDSWGVDYGLLDADGRHVGPVHAYRSDRTAGVMEAVTQQVTRERIYSATGIQFLPFNTVYQLVAATTSADRDLAAASTMLMVPDLINHELCGSTTNDVTNASTTQLLDATTHEWSDELVDALGLRRDLLPTLHEPGTRLGQLADGTSPAEGLDVIAAASHDTASAVAGTPLAHDRQSIYISCGTWALVGCERAAPVLTPLALAANVTNEVGIEGTTRLLKNVTGLWLLEECRREWTHEPGSSDVTKLVAAAADVPGGRSVIDPDDPRFAGPGSMVGRIGDACRATGQLVPQSPAEVTRVILDSLALAWRRTVATIERVADFEAEIIHLVGGGAANTLLARLCASACGRPVLLGPTEASVIGNALAQAIAGGAVRDIADGRALLARAMTFELVQPSDTLDWAALADRVATSRGAST